MPLLYEVQPDLVIEMCCTWAYDTSDLEHQTKVTEPNTHDAANLEKQTEMTEPDMHTATDHTVNKENSVPLTKILYNSTVCIPN